MTPLPPRPVVDSDAMNLAIMYTVAEARASRIRKYACCCLPILGSLRLIYNFVGGVWCTVCPCRSDHSEMECSGEIPDDFCQEDCLKPAKKVNYLAEIYFCAFCGRGYNARVNPERFLDEPERQYMKDLKTILKKKASEPPPPANPLVLKSQFDLKAPLPLVVEEDELEADP